MQENAQLAYHFSSFWIESPNRRRKRIVNVLCPYDEALPYALHPAADELVSKRRAPFFEKIRCRFFASERPPAGQLVDFFEGLRRCLKIGLSVLDAIDMSVNSAKAPMFRGIIASIHLKMRDGDTLSQAMAQFPKTFDPFVVATVAAAEEAGNLPDALEKLTFALIRANQLRKKLISGMVYPAIIVLLGIAVVTLLSFTLIPATFSNFSQFNAEIPWYSKAVAMVASMIRNYWWLAIPGFMLSFLARDTVVNIWKSGPIQWLLVRTPIIAPVVRGLALSRVLRTMGTLLGTGVDVRTSFQLTAETAGHPEYSEYVNNIAKHVMDGDEYYEAFLLERDLIGEDGQRIADYMHIGSKTGEISSILESLAEVEEEDAFQKTEKLPKLLEPLIMAALAGVIGVIMAAVYLPTLLLAQEVLNNR